MSNCVQFIWMMKREGSCDSEVITRLFSYWPLYQSLITARGVAKGSCWQRAWYRANMLRCLYSANASCSNNQSETSIAVHDIWKFQAKLQSIEILALIPAAGIPPLLVITARLQTMYRLIYVDSLIMPIKSAHSTLTDWLTDWLNLYWEDVFYKCL